MNNQRVRLSDYYNKRPMRYHATFGYITHKKSGRSVILLKNLYFVDKNGRKIPMRKNSDIVINGKHYISDHVWVNLTKPWLETGLELLCGDEVEFSASVEKYKITRRNVLDKRNDIYYAAQAKSDQVYLDFQQDVQGQYVKDFKKKLQQVKNKQKRIMDKARRDIKNVELVDYGLNYIKDIKVVSYKRVYYGFEREKYNAKLYSDSKYINYLAWHSAQYKDECEKRNRYVQRK